MIFKNTKTILFASLIVAMILPFSGMNFAQAEKQPYTLEEIDHAFYVSEPYVTFANDNKMIVNKSQMKDDGISKIDIKIIKKWAKIYNKIMDATISDDEELNQSIQDKMDNGRFQLLTNPDLLETGVTGQSHQPTNWLTLNACGITYGSSSHAEPALTVTYQLYPSKEAMANQLVASGYSKLTGGFGGGDADLVAQERDYGRINTTGYGGCTGGEFRDQQVITHNDIEYNESFYVNGQTYKGIGATAQYNEPNSNLNEYVAPTLWWGVYVWGWHESN